jgi:hypothetical protein
MHSLHGCIIAWIKETRTMMDKSFLIIMVIFGAACIIKVVLKIMDDE